jgi:hypothetical protein
LLVLCLQQEYLALLQQKFLQMYFILHQELELELELELVSSLSLLYIENANLPRISSLFHV